MKLAIVTNGRRFLRALRDATSKALQDCRLTDDNQTARTSNKGEIGQ